MFSPGPTGYFGYQSANKQLLNALKVLQHCSEQCIEEDLSNSAELLEAIAYLETGIDARYCLRFRQALLVENQELRQRNAKAALKNILRQIPPDLTMAFTLASR